MFQRITAAFVAASVIGCGYGGTARATFSSANTCPNGRITVISRSEIAGNRIDPNRAFSPIVVTPGAAAPQEIQNDPERLRLWKKTHPDTTSGGESSGWGAAAVYEVSGCGVTTWYACATESANQGTPQYYEHDYCEKGVPPGPKSP